jgi:1,5-anhydro-D-fructose reductase (1,5-anhydro-D-mannitol-forming)
VHGVNIVRWGIIGCGDVAEVKSGPGFQKTRGSALIAVMRRDRAKAEDFARRHGVPRVYADADALISDSEVDAVYIATPPSSHCELALRVANAGKPCLVEKPMAISHQECIAMIDGFAARRTPLWVAYYRRALPRFLTARDLLVSGAIGRVTSVHITVQEPLAARPVADQWRFDPAIAGGGLFLDLGSHCLDLVDFLVGPISAVVGYAINSGGAYPVEDTGSRGELHIPVFTDGDVLVVSDGQEQIYPLRNPPHVHQPLIQTIVDELRGEGRCESTGASAARTSWVMDRCLESYRRAVREAHQASTS